MKKIFLTAVLSAMLLNPVAAQQPRNIELINQYTILIKKNPKDVTSLLGRGMLYSQMGLTENAIADLSAALKISPTHPRLLEARALAYQVGGYYSL
jgi:regulator of sirC expression with transglutaminase-like and TPR domain